ncbi:TRAP transporter small permease [Sagittula salina]|uniref:TRAP transporter small permease protein n=1 Tax=Sagittula salina TaxID=2820268 RepID=A0A940S1G6_9RHOB|nr:TRAP transporter small permease subunit [Sagittula salina]MBP0484128.1 TRAP transporter small permease subunit [Sagittula salina]
MAGLHRIVLGLARLMALAGGVVLTFLIVMVCLSIIGRAGNGVLHWMLDAGFMTGTAQGLIDWGFGAIRGDFELVEAGMAFCIFAFLPYCTVTGGHASVDVFTNFLPRGVNRVLDVLIAVLFAVVLVVIAMQLYEGFLRKMSSGQTTLLLEFPVSWAYGASLVGAVAAAAVGCYLVMVRVYEILTGRLIVPNAVGADH